MGRSQDCYACKRIRDRTSSRRPGLLVEVVGRDGALIPWDLMVVQQRMSIRKFTSRDCLIIRDRSPMKLYVGPLLHRILFVPSLASSHPVPC